MANSGDSNPSQSGEPTQDGENPGLPVTSGKATSLGPEVKAPTPAKSGSSASGDLPAKAPMPSAASWPPRVVKAPAEEDRKTPLDPPYEPDKTPEGELLKVDYAPLGTSDAIGNMIAVAAKDTAIAAATTLHPSDPAAAALAATEALTAVLKTTSGTSYAAPGGRETTSSTPHSERLAQEAVLAGIMGGRTDAGR